MTPDDLEPMEGSLSSLLEAERRAPAAPGAAKSRVHTRLAVGLFGAGAAVAAAAAAVPKAVAAAPQVAAASTATTAAATTSTGLAMGTVVKLAVGIGLASFAAGGVTGAEWVRREVESRPPVVAPVVVTPPVVPAPVEPIIPTPVVVDAPPKLLSAKAPPAPAPIRTATPTTTDDEHSLLEQARAALTRGQVDSALTVLAEHQSRFPEGRLAEERTGLQVIALAQSGHQAQARELGALFRAQYPHSLLLPAIDRVLNDDK